MRREDHVWPRFLSRHFNQHGRSSAKSASARKSFAIDGGGCATIPGVRATGRRFYYYRLSSPLRQRDGLMLLRSPTSRAMRAARRAVVDAIEEIKTSRHHRIGMTIRIRAARGSGVSHANRKAVIAVEILNPPRAQPPARRRRDPDSRIAEGHSRFHLGRKAGFGMTEYIERIEDGKLAGYPL